MVELVFRQGGAVQIGEKGQVMKADYPRPGLYEVDFPSQKNYSVTSRDIKLVGGSIMPRKFNDGDIVEFTEDINKDSNTAKGKKARIAGYSTDPWGNGNYILDFTVQNPSYDKNHNALAYTANKLKLSSLPAPKPKVKVSFESVVMPDHKREQILEALEQINQAELIFDVWGFGETIEKGRGVSMLFYGPPGTGKTLMAQAIADKFDYKLKVLSTADIESSVPGEAERNIRKYFTEGKDDKSIILFDECDSLIYSRQSVGAILGAQINELLSQLERFDGITIFTTNRLGTLDEAVNRRLALKLEFAMPTRAERAEIWKRMMPKKAPLGEIDWHKLAVVELTGGYIKNAVLRAARMAAAEKVPKRQKKIHQAHLVKALKLEAESMIDFQKANKEHDKSRRITLEHHGAGISKGVSYGN